MIVIMIKLNNGFIADICYFFWHHQYCNDILTMRYDNYITSVVKIANGFKTIKKINKLPNKAMNAKTQNEWIA